MATDSSNQNGVYDAKVEQLIKRVTIYKNPFDVLDVAKDTLTEDIQKKYKKLALLVHPDKCSHPKAKEAFENLKTAMQTIEKKERREMYSLIMQKAEEKLMSEWHAKGKKVDIDDEDFIFERRKQTQRIIIELEVQSKRADQIKTANEKREREEIVQFQKDWQAHEEMEKKWEEGREQRVGNWRTFQHGSKVLKKSATDSPSSAATPTSPTEKPTSPSKEPAVPKPLVSVPPPPPSIPPPPPPTTKTKPKVTAAYIKPVVNETKKYVPKMLKPPKVKLNNS